MIIKDSKKSKRATRNPVITIDDDDTQFCLPIASKRGEKKHSNQKKKKSRNSKLKNAASIDPPIIIESCSDSEPVKEAEKPPKASKKKRRHAYEQDSNPKIPSQGQKIECQETSFLVGKKRKKNSFDSCGDDGEYKKKKRKKKNKLAGSMIPLYANDNYSKNDLPPTVKTISHEMMLSDRKKTQNVVSKGGSKPICRSSSTNSQGARNGVLERAATDPVHGLQEANNCQEDNKDTSCLLKKKRQVTEQKEKKKWKKLEEEEAGFILTSASNQDNNPAELWKMKSGEKQEKIDLNLNSEGGGKGRKKKKNHTQVTYNYPDLAEDSKNTFGWEQKAIKGAKKKAKKSKKESDPAVKLESGSFRKNRAKQRDTTKRKARKGKRFEGLEEEPSSKRAKLTKKEREHEIQIVAIKKGNCDEISIDKLRRQALQEEIDRESGKTKAIKEKDDSDQDHRFGQWSTATFDSAEEKSKFLRLLGGFKKGSGLTPEWPAKARQRNMALGRHGEEKLQQTLQAEFEKAMNWQQRRSTGLGFQPAPQKWVYIDKHASKSIKFED